ncbi:hypothetical protein JCM17823_18400 [Halorubrum gandharaense]
MSEQRGADGERAGEREGDEERDSAGHDADRDAVTTDDEPDPKGIREGLADSEGDPRLVFLLGVALSAWFGWVVVWGFDLLGLVEYTLVNVLTAAILVFAVTYVLVLQ